MDLHKSFDELVREDIKAKLPDSTAHFGDYTISAIGDSIVYRIKGNKWNPDLEGEANGAYVEIKGTTICLHNPEYGIDRKIDLTEKINKDSEKSKKLNEMVGHNSQKPYMTLDYIRDVMEVYISRDEPEEEFKWFATDDQKAIKNILAHMENFHNILMNVSPIYRVVNSYEREMEARAAEYKEQTAKRENKSKEDEQKISKLEAVVEKQSKMIEEQNETIQEQATQIQEKNGIIDVLRKRARQAIEYATHVQGVVSKKGFVTTNDLKGVGKKTNEFIKESDNIEL